MRKRTNQEGEEIKAKKIVLIIVMILVLGLGTLLALRFIFGGSEDTWICDNSEWVKHGEPSVSKPTTSCNGNYKK